jgi:hypothetical protein
MLNLDKLFTDHGMRSCLRFLQISAVGVWGTPDALTCRAADLVALPTAQLLRKANQHKGMFSSICGKALVSMNLTVGMLMDARCSSPCISRDELIGMLPQENLREKVCIVRCCIALYCAEL